MYVTVVIRADTAYAINILSQFLLNPSPHHIEVTDHCLAYPDTHQILTIKYSELLINDIRIFHYSSNAAFADNPDQKSSHSYLFKLYESAIVWKAMKQS